jgi:hypothetical protein
MNHIPHTPVHCEDGENRTARISNHLLKKQSDTHHEHRFEAKSNKFCN